MTPEQYEAVCERLRKARAIAEEKIKKQTQAPEPEPVYEEPEVAPEPEPVYELPPPPTSVPKPKKSVASTSAPKPVKPKPEPVNLDEYFEAKYRAKSKYIQPQPSYNHPYQDEVNKQMKLAPEPSPAHLIQQSAREQIRGRVNNEMFNLAMRSVFPTM